MESSEIKNLFLSGVSNSSVIEKNEALEAESRTDEAILEGGVAGVCFTKENHPARRGGHPSSGGECGEVTKNLSNSVS